VLLNIGQTESIEIPLIVIREGNVIRILGALRIATAACKQILKTAEENTEND
jgi:hypothetical protein